MEDFLHARQVLYPLSLITRPIILHWTSLQSCYVESKGKVNFPLFSCSQGKRLVVAPDVQSLGQRRALLTTRLVYFNQLHSDPGVWSALTHLWL